MAELIRALTEAVDKIGLTAVLIIVVALSAVYVVRWNRQLVDRVVALTEKTTDLQGSISKLSDQTITRNTVASDSNTASNLKLEGTVGRLEETVGKLVDSFGSDWNRLAKITRALEREGYDEKTIVRIIRRLEENGNENAQRPTQ